VNAERPGRGGSCAGDVPPGPGATATFCARTRRYEGRRPWPSAWPWRGSAPSWPVPTRSCRPWSGVVAGSGGPWLLLLAALAVLSAGRAAASRCWMRQHGEPRAVCRALRPRRHPAAAPPPRETDLAALRLPPAVAAALRLVRRRARAGSRPTSRLGRPGAVLSSTPRRRRWLGLCADGAWRPCARRSGWPRRASSGPGRTPWRLRHALWRHAGRAGRRGGAGTVAERGSVAIAEVPELFVGGSRTPGLGSTYARPPRPGRRALAAAQPSARREHPVPHAAREGGWPDPERPRAAGRDGRAGRSACSRAPAGQGLPPAQLTEASLHEARAMLRAAEAAAGETGDPDLGAAGCCSALRTRRRASKSCASPRTTSRLVRRSTPGKPVVALPVFKDDGTLARE
jgi:hypothetical protein